MIPYHELERALQRWKIRQAGGQPGAVEESPVETTDESVNVDSVNVDSGNVESSYVEAEAEAAFPSQNAGTNEIVLEGELDDR